MRSKKIKNLLKLYTIKIKKKGLPFFESDITMNINHFIKKNAIKTIENEIVFNKEYCLKHKELLLNNGFSDYQIRSIYENELTPIYFHNEILSTYTNNSFYTFEWYSYRGTIYSNENAPDNIYIKNINLAHDLRMNKPVVMLFLYEILEQDIDFQRFIKRYEVKNTINIEPAHQNVKNLIYGIRTNYDEIDIYNILLVGMKIINEISNNKYDDLFFLNLKNTNEYEHFHPIFISSTVNYYYFIIELSKIFYENINKKLVKRILTTKGIYKNKKEMKDISIVELITLLVDPSFQGTVKNFLSLLIKARNVPAHEIYENNYDPKYWKKQDDILIFAYQFLYSFILSWSCGKLPTKFSNYHNIYGENGGISYGNGFNLSPYKYYDGQFCLVCEMYGSKDAEYLIAFKADRFSLDKLIHYIKNRRPDLKENSIDYVVKKIFSNELIKPSKKAIQSFFNGYVRTNRQLYDQNEILIEANKIYYNFVTIYPIDNIFVFADSTDPHYNDFDNDCFNEKKLQGKGYITELLRYFKNNYEHDNVITNPDEDLEIQILSNIWD